MGPDLSRRHLGELTRSRQGHSKATTTPRPAMGGNGSLLSQARDKGCSSAKLIPSPVQSTVSPGPWVITVPARALCLPQWTARASSLFSKLLSHNAQHTTTTQEVLTPSSPAPGSEPPVHCAHSESPPLLSACCLAHSQYILVRFTPRVLPQRARTPLTRMYNSIQSLL